MGRGIGSINKLRKTSQSGDKAEGTEWAKAWQPELEWSMASHRQEQEENPGLAPRPDLCRPSTAAQCCLFVPSQALKDVKTLGCRKAMNKFERHTLLVSGGLHVAV